MLTPVPGRYAVLLPAVAEAARRLGATTIGLVDVGRPGGVNLDLDRVHVRYDDGTTLGDPAAPVQVDCSLRGDRSVPSRPLPPVVARLAADVGATEALPDALAEVPDDALPVVTTTWSLSRIAPARRPAFLATLEHAAATRPMAWVSVEGVGVAPGVDTLGDRPASGHSLVGIAVPDDGGLRVETVARCWSRGRYLAWLADDAS